MKTTDVQDPINREDVQCESATWNSSNKERCTPETWAGRCHSAGGDACGPCQEAASLGLRVIQLEEDLATVRAKQSSTNAKINAVHDPLSRLPVELASNIFMCLKPPPIDPAYRVDFLNPDDVAKHIESMKGMKAPLVLGAVCRAWRAFSWSIPQLWSTISVDVYNHSEGAPDIVQQWLGRSGQLPLSIYFYAERGRIVDGVTMPPPCGHEPYIQRLMDVINAYSGRWFHLNLNTPRHFMHRLHCSGLEASMLEILTLQNSADDGDDGILYTPINFRKTPKLRKVYFRHVPYEDLDLHWENITHVEITFTTVEMAWDLLRKAPFLKHLGVEDLVDYENGPQENIQHDHLTSLHLKDSQRFDSNAHMLLAYLVLPALQDIEICTNATVRLPFVEGVIWRSSCILKTLTVAVFDSWMETKEELIALLEMAPTLEILNLECRYHHHRNSTLPSQFPTTAIIQEMEAISEHIFLPNLDEVHIKIDYGHWSCVLDLRLLAPHGRTDFLLGGVHDIYIVPRNTCCLKPLFIYYLLDPATQQTIQPIIEGGFSVTFPQANMHLFMAFLRQALYRSAYDAGVPSPS